MTRWQESTGRPCPAPNVTRIGTCGLLFAPDEAQVLVHQRADNGFWGFPGGALEHGESVLEALGREITEETGLVIPAEAWTLTGIYSRPDQWGCNRYQDGTIIHYCCLSFRTVLSPALFAVPLCCSVESRALRWALPGDLPRPFLPGHLLRLLDTRRRPATFPIR